MLGKEETTVTNLDKFFQKLLLDLGKNCSIEPISKEALCCMKQFVLSDQMNCKGIKGVGTHKVKQI